MRVPTFDRLIAAVIVERVRLGGQIIEQETGRRQVWAARVDANVSSELVSGQVGGVARYLVSDQSVYLVRATDADAFTVGATALDENGQTGRIAGKEPMGRNRYTQLIWERA